MTRPGSAVDEDRWSLAEAAVERTVELALRAIIAGDQPALRQLGGEVRKLRFGMALDHNMSEEPTAERIVGSLPAWPP